jgi:hypothetical protein
LKESQSEEYDWKNGVYFNLTVASFPSFTDSYWENELGKLERTKSELGHSSGAEIEFCYSKFFLRGVYQTGHYKYKNSGIANHYLAGLDLGFFFFGDISESAHGVFAFGYRNLRIQREYEKVFTPDNSALRYTEPIIVIILRSNPTKSGFIFNFETDLSFRGIPAAFTEDTEHLGVSFFLDIGARFGAIPLSLTIGGEVLIYEPGYAKIIEKRPSIASIYKKAEVDATFGAILKLSYILELW